MKREIDRIIKYKRDNFLLLDFCNLKKITHRAIFTLHQKFEIYQTEEGKETGGEKWCQSKNDPDKRYWYLIEDEKLKKHDDYKSGIYILPSEKNNDEILTYLEQSQKEYKNFLDKCAEGHLDLIFLNNIINDFSAIGIYFKKSKDEWMPEISHYVGIYRTFESFIDWEILDLRLRNASHIFERVKKCKWQKCGKYFIYKRKDQKYCDDKCSRSKRSHDFRQTPGYKESYKKTRVSGEYIKVANR